MQKKRRMCGTLYRQYTKPQLEALCRRSNLPVVSSHLKHDPEQSLTSREYGGNLSSIPTTTAVIHLITIPYLKSVLT